MNLQFFGVDTPMLKNGQAVREARSVPSSCTSSAMRSGCCTSTRARAPIAMRRSTGRRAYKVGAGIGWDQARSTAISASWRAARLNATEVDRKSIMHYCAGADPVQARQGQPVFRSREPDLSEQDRKFIASVYPKDEAPMAVSSVPPTALTRSAAKRPPPARIARPSSNGTRSC